MAKVGMQNHGAIKKVAGEHTNRETWQSYNPEQYCLKKFS